MIPRSRYRGAPFQRLRSDLNEGIRAPEVRAVFPDGSVEVMPTQAAIRRAKEMGLDLILVAPTAAPPVAKAMDYGQWQYEKKKKESEAKKKQHTIQVKEVKFRPNTKEHDYEFKKNHIIRFLKDGNRVKAVVQFRGREITHSEIGREMLARLLRELADLGTAEGGVRQEGHHASVILSPLKTQAKDQPQQKQKASKPEQEAAQS